MASGYVRDARWRYIRYQDGSEELYDHVQDPQEWTNRAGDPALTGIKAQLARHLPAEEARPTAAATARTQAGKGRKKAR